MAIVKAPSQTSPSLLDLSSMQTPVNGMAAGAQGAAPGSFQLLFQGSLQAQDKVAANGQNLPAEGENLPGRLPADGSETGAEVGAAAADMQTGQQDADNLSGMPPQAGTAQASVQDAANQAQTTDAKPTSSVSGQVQSEQLPAGQQPPQEPRPGQQSTQATNVASGAAGANGKTSEQSVLSQQQLAAQAQAGQQALTQAEQKAQTHQRAEQHLTQTEQQNQQRIEQQQLTKAEQQALQQAQAQQRTNQQQVQSQAQQRSVQQQQIETKQLAQQAVEQRQAGQEAMTQTQLRNQALRNAGQQQATAKAQQLTAEAESEQPKIPQAEQGRESRSQLPSNAAEQARVEAQARVAANGAVDNASAQPHPLSGTTSAETAQGGQAETLEGDAKVPVSAGQTSASAIPASQTAANNGVATAQADAEAAPDPVTILASQDAVQARQTQQTSGESRGPTQLVAPAAPADNAPARQAPLDPAQVRGAEAGSRVDVSALNTGGSGAGGMGSESGDSGSQRQDSGAQTSTTQNTQTAQPRNPQAAQAQAQQLLNTHPQLLTPRWGQAVGERMIMMAQHGPRSAQIQLDPPELGSMQIRVHVQGQDQISVSFTSPNPAVRDALEQQMPRLREMLAEQGLELSEGAISDDSSSSGQGSDSRGGSEGRAGGYAGGSSGELDSEPLPGSTVAVGLVDYYA